MIYIYITYITSPYAWQGPYNTTTQRHDTAAAFNTASTTVSSKTLTINVVASETFRPPGSATLGLPKNMGKIPHIE